MFITPSTWHYVLCATYVSTT
ncbi:hypothetical protein SEA_EFFIE_730 [Acinetobacter phage Effie]|nr:hypothetical protein SEA_EFFIE_730 [Acinetobacter phage Effie]